MDCFFKDQERVGNMSFMDIAREIGIGDMSITRFIRAIGYLGFTSPKDDIYNSLIREASASVWNIQLSKRFDVLIGKYRGEDMPGAFVEMMNYNITHTFQQNSLKSYERLADMIIESKKKYVAGLRGRMGVSAHFSRLLGLAINGITHLPSNNKVEVLRALQDVELGGILVLFSFTRYYKIDMSLISMAKGHKDRIYVTADNLMALVIKYAGISLVMETSHMGFPNSAIDADTIAEYIMTLVCRKNKEKYRL